MSCGNTVVQDPLSRFWILGVDDFGTFNLSLTTAIFPFFTTPILNSPSFSWQISALTNGTLTATRVSGTVAPSGFTLASPRQNDWTLSIDDNGNIASTFAGIGVVGVVPYPVNISMSQWPQSIGLTSTLTGSSPLTVGADFSIWSCLLNKFINEDTTNIVVVLDE
jgi:hypothetical protein